MESIKDYRNKELIAYIIANVIFIIFLSNSISINDALKYSESIIKIGSSLLFSSIVSVFAYFSDSILRGDIKDKVVDLWRRRPGEVVFSEIKLKSKDVRFTREQAIEKYKDIYDAFPTEKKEKYRYENSNWYKIYHKYRKAEKVYNSNRDYLLCRDMHIVTYVITILYTVISLFTDFTNLTIACIVFEIALLILTNIMAREKAKRFVYNVIAYDLQQSEMPKNYFFQGEGMNDNAE